MVLGSGWSFPMKKKLHDWGSTSTSNKYLYGQQIVLYVGVWLFMYVKLNVRKHTQVTGEIVLHQTKNNWFMKTV